MRGKTRKDAERRGKTREPGCTEGNEGNEDGEWAEQTFLLWIALAHSGVRWIALDYSGRPPVGVVENAIEGGLWGRHFLSQCKREKFHYPSRFG